MPLLAAGNFQEASIRISTENVKRHFSLRVV
jgi:hypothetical protein